MPDNAIYYKDGDVGFQDGDFLWHKKSMYLSWNGGTPVEITVSGIYYLPDTGGKWATVTVNIDLLPVISGDGTYTLNTANSGLGFIPKIYLSWSNDSGHTWSSDYEGSIGKRGQYWTRAIWRRIGYARNRTFRISIADKIKKVIIGAVVE
jgi:hypothetical protein